ncbi:MAG: hypothetical protein WD801_16200 [Gemmatimonadaceae bacterium]
MNGIGRVLCVVAVLSLPGCIHPGAGISPLGRQATIHPIGGSPWKGELLAVSSDTVWLLTGDFVSALRSDAIDRVVIRRHDFDAQRTFKWMTIAGAATGVALMISCTTYKASPDADGGSGGCVGTIPFAVLTFLLPGSLFALSNHLSAHQRFAPRDTYRLLPYARFPQGLPDTIRMVSRVHARP